MRMSVGVDLHKKHFTVYWRVEGQPERGEYNRYLTNEDGYDEFEQKLRAVASLSESISVAVKNQIHGLLLSLGIESKRGELQSKKERRRVQSVLAAQQLAGAAVDPLFETIDRLSAEVKKLLTVMEELVKDDPVVELIRTIPGAGLITATTIRAYLDDIARFESPKQLAAYAGVPARTGSWSATAG